MSTGLSAPSQGYDARPLPAPPRLHWAWVLVIDVVTWGLFGIIWVFVQSKWVRRVRGTSRAFTLSIVYLCAIPATFFFAFTVGVVGTLVHPEAVDATAKSIGNLTQIVFLILRLVVLFTLRSELQSGEVGLTLGPFMTFFFGEVYFQYHLHDYSGAPFGDTTTLGL